jgi:hypothetical protein
MMNVWNDWMAYSQVYVKLGKGGIGCEYRKTVKYIIQQV